jgi:O-antigen/teichoic acid export membrane protein
MLMVIATPVYVGKLGLEGYGIIGLWTIMQFLMGLLDLGVGATLVRELANSAGQEGGADYRRNLLRTLELVGWGVSLAFSIAVISGAGWIAGSWLKLPTLPKPYVTHAIQIMAVAMALQFPFAIYSNSLCGLQEQGRMNLMQVAGSTARYGVGIIVLYWKQDLTWFFGAQALVAGGQTLITRHMVWRLISAGGSMWGGQFSLAVLKGVSSFSIGMALNTLVGVLLGNADRLLLSGRLSMVELGRYTAAYTAASMLQMGIQPFYRSYFPRYSELAAEPDGTRLRTEYFQSNRLMGIAIIPICVVALIFAPEVFWVWFGKHDLEMLGTFRWLVVGMTGAGVAWLPAAYQQAHGWTRLHVGMMVAALMIGVPCALFGIRWFGAVGATAIWVVHGLLEITIGLWLMHRKLLKGDLMTWYGTVLLPPLLIGVPLAYLSKWMMPIGMSRIASFGWVVATGLCILCVALLLFFNRKIQFRKAPDTHGIGDPL